MYIGYLRDETTLNGNLKKSLYIFPQNQTEFDTNWPAKKAFIVLNI